MESYEQEAGCRNGRGPVQQPHPELRVLLQQQGAFRGVLHQLRQLRIQKRGFFGWTQFTAPDSGPFERNKDDIYGFCRYHK